MEAKASARYVRVSPRKVRQLADLVRGGSVGEALNILHFSPKAAARLLEKVVYSAVRNALNKEGSAKVDDEDLVVKQVYVDDGPTLRRFRIRARSIVRRIRKRSCHITVVVTDEEV